MRLLSGAVPVAGPSAALARCPEHDVDPAAAGTWAAGDDVLQRLLP